MAKQIATTFPIRDILSTLLKGIKWGIYSFGIFFLVDRHISIGIGRGASMFPTFQDGDLLLKEGITWRYFRRPFRVGDVIVYRSPFNRSEYFVKRIVALQGGVIMKDETFEFEIPSRGYVVPYGHVWVEGDNRQFSRDSRTYGPISVNLIEYRVIARIWPSWKWAYNPLFCSHIRPNERQNS